jgi:uncharacterized protein
MEANSERSKTGSVAPSSGLFINTGEGPTFQPIDIGHLDYFGVIEPDTAFWSLVRRDRLADALTGGGLMEAFGKKAASFASEMETLRFGLKPSAVYFNPTDRCNLNCPYCYIPEDIRQGGRHMSEKRLIKALGILKDYFRRTLPEGETPQIIFHGAEPLLNSKAVFAGIEEYGDDFRFGLQTNATMLDDAAVKFLTDRNVSIGISLDAPTAAVGNLTRVDWEGTGVHGKVVTAMERLRGYDGWSVICTITSANMRHLTKLVEFLHAHEAPTALMNIVRCTLPSSLEVKPDDAGAAGNFLAALERTHELYLETGRKLPIANFANILLAIMAPAARRLMCDISPCGGGRCFFAMSANGDLFPCSEFIGLKPFRGGNLFKDDIEKVLSSQPFERVTGRRVEDIDPCNRCAIRHFCGAPCPAEACEANGGMDKIGAFCEFYEEQVRYAFRLIADGKEEAFLWDGWAEGTTSTFEMAGFRV